MHVVSVITEKRTRCFEEGQAPRLEARAGRNSVGRECFLAGTATFLKVVFNRNRIILPFKQISMIS